MLVHLWTSLGQAAEPVTFLFFEITKHLLSFLLRVRISAYLLWTQRKNMVISALKEKPPCISSSCIPENSILPKPDWLSLCDEVDGEGSLPGSKKKRKVLTQATDGRVAVGMISHAPHIPLFNSVLSPYILGNTIFLGVNPPNVFSSPLMQECLPSTATRPKGSCFSEC